MDGWMDSEVDDGLMVEWMGRQADRQIDRCINRSWIDVVIWRSRWTEGWMDG